MSFIRDLNTISEIYKEVSLHSNVVKKQNKNKNILKVSLSCLMGDQYIMTQRAADTERYIFAQGDETILDMLRDRDWQRTSCGFFKIKCKIKCKLAHLATFQYLRSSRTTQTKVTRVNIKCCF